MNQITFTLITVAVWAFTNYLAWTRRNRFRGFTDLPPARMANLATLAMGAFTMWICLIIVVLDLIFDI